MLLIVGAVIVIGSVMGGYLMHGGNVLVLNQPSEFLIIGGAALGNLLIGTPPSVLKQLVGQTTAILGSGMTKTDYKELLAMLYQLFKLGQQSGVMALESHFDSPAASPIMSKYPRFLKNHHAVDFLADSIKVIMTGGIGPHDLEALMDQDLEVRHHEMGKAAGALAKIADALPGLGIVAAVLGVVITMESIGGPASEIGHKVGAALVGTFLGILLSYGFVQPLATSLEARVGDDGHYEQCIKTGLLAMYKGFPPMVAVEFARRVLPSEVRPSFDETEELVKGAKVEAAA
ncbi:MAG: flagellar motor stator protein MotA [Acidobacteria bacterium]|nr:flagellar motor stator protein MotA [Acidobacteriota bacterium]